MNQTPVDVGAGLCPRPVLRATTRGRPYGGFRWRRLGVFSLKIAALILVVTLLAACADATPAPESGGDSDAINQTATAIIVQATAGQTGGQAATPQPADGTPDPFQQTATAIVVAATAGQLGRQSGDTNDAQGTPNEFELTGTAISAQATAQAGGGSGCEEKEQALTSMTDMIAEDLTLPNVIVNVVVAGESCGGAFTAEQTLYNILLPDDDLAAVGDAMAAVLDVLADYRPDGDSLGVVVVRVEAGGLPLLEVPYVGALAAAEADRDGEALYDALVAAQ